MSLAKLIFSQNDVIFSMMPTAAQILHISLSFDTDHKNTVELMTPVVHVLTHFKK